VTEEWYSKAWARAIAADEGRARQVAKSPACEVYGGLVTTGGKLHASCRPGSLAGQACICRPGCTDRRWGDGGTCSPECVPCLVMRGHIYNKP
jgi:hypothetical protein